MNFGQYRPPDILVSVFLKSEKPLIKILLSDVNQTVNEFFVTVGSTLLFTSLYDFPSMTT